MKVGTVKWADVHKNCGFIVSEDDEKSIFIHRSQIVRLGVQLPENGQKVAYEVSESGDGAFLSMFRKLKVI